MLDTLQQIGHALHWALHTPPAVGALSGWGAAARVDYEAFKHWQNFHDFADYGWSTAIFRWIKGAIIGGLTGAGIGGLL